MKEEGENSPGGGANEQTEDDECMIISQVGPANKPALLMKHEPPPLQAVYQSPQVITLADDGEDEGRGTAGSNGERGAEDLYSSALLPVHYRKNLVSENEIAQNRHSSTDDLSSDEGGAPLSVLSETGEDEGVNAVMEKVNSYWLGVGGLKRL